MHSEALAAFTAVLFYVCLLRARRSASSTSWALVGMSATAAMLTRSALVSFLPSAAIVLWRSSLGRTRSAALVAFGVAALSPILVYGSVAKVAFGTFGITFFDGASLFSLVASKLDCGTRATTSAPSLRATLCSDPLYLQSDPWTILWSEGPIQKAIRIHGWPATNRDLRWLALDTIVHHPTVFARSLGLRLEESLAIYDPPYATHPSETALAHNVAHDFAIALATYPHHGGQTWASALSGWYACRLVLFAGLLAATTMCWGYPRAFDSLPMQALAVISWGVLITTLATAYVTPRLLYPLECPAIIASAWLLERAVHAWRSVRQKSVLHD